MYTWLLDDFLRGYPSGHLEDTLWKTSGNDLAALIPLSSLWLGYHWFLTFQSTVSNMFVCRFKTGNKKGVSYFYFIFFGSIVVYMLSFFHWLWLPSNDIVLSFGGISRGIWMLLKMPCFGDPIPNIGNPHWRPKVMVFPFFLWRKNTSKLRAVWGKIHQVETSLKTMRPAHHHSIILTCHGVSVPLLQSLQSATNTKDTIDSDASREASTNKPKHSASGKNPTRPVEVVERCGVFNQTNVPSCFVIKFKGCIYRLEIFDAVGVWSHLMFSWHWACCQQKNAPHPQKNHWSNKASSFWNFFLLFSSLIGKNKRKLLTFTGINEFEMTPKTTIPS